ncbi:MAG: hypothetical protein WAO95_16630 [Burkholderiales bacterium]
MLSKMIRISAAIALVALLTGFGAGTPVYNVASAPIPPNPAATLENIEKAIIRAGLQLGWKIAPQGPGKAEGVLVLRKHTAVVDITYDTKGFSITYKSSINLDYKPETKTIHSNYNGWIKNLEKAIIVQASVL